MSLKAIATPAAREPGPFVTRCRSRTVAKVDSIGGDQAAVSSQYQGKVLARKGNTWVEIFVQGTSNDRANVTTLASLVVSRL